MASDAPDAATEAARRRIVSRLPHLRARVEQLLRLAAIDATGPDPEAALYQLARAANALATFVRLTPATADDPRSLLEAGGPAGYASLLEKS